MKMLAVLPCRRTLGPHAVEKKVFRVFERLSRSAPVGASKSQNRRGEQNGPQARACLGSRVEPILVAGLAEDGGGECYAPRCWRRVNSRVSESSYRWVDQSAPSGVGEASAGRAPPPVRGARKHARWCGRAGGSSSDRRNQRPRAARRTARSPPRRLMRPVTGRGISAAQIRLSSESSRARATMRSGSS